MKKVKLTKNRSSGAVDILRKVTHADQRVEVEAILAILVVRHRVRALPEGTAVRGISEVSLHSASGAGK